MHCDPAHPGIVVAKETIDQPECRTSDGSQFGDQAGRTKPIVREDERLTIQYDGGTGAQPYIAGTLLAIRRVPEVVGLVRGLDRIL